MQFLNSNRNVTQKYCEEQQETFLLPEGELWCNWVWDSILCWPPTKAGSSTKLRCPLEKGIDLTKFAEKRCGENGLWVSRSGLATEKDSPIGWTNYTPCYTEETISLFQKIYAGSEEDARMKFNIAEWTRNLEFVGLTVSLVALLISLAIFCQFRSLRNTRTRIHKNLFVAMVIQVVIRLTLYIDQALSKRNLLIFKFGIENIPVLCETTYVLLEYARTAMFMWMFIEGFFLHSIISVTVFQEASYYQVYRLVGWGPPAFLTLAWATVTAIYYHPSKCWWGYNLTSYFWILEAPRMAVIVVNFLFLVNIIRVLVVKLHQSHSSETEKVRKAVKAAVVLLPLLGITNFLSMIKAPLARSVWEFGLWSFITHFLTSFQGLLIASFYCFFNGEVRLALKKTISVQWSIRASELRKPSHLNASQTRRITSERNFDYLCIC
ncbi:PDF receptor [Belonocnema kinseyi]|uniref:PDF receptor n=1 Tax=Belonocnema kinseyi TaxID=2817044 RepID=UPI00143CFDCC|nr:PDF receptor [Belonocnema kinseyi]